MRKLIVSMNITLDGFMAGPHCELDWHFDCWNEEMAHYALEELGHADTLLLGRATYNAMASFWPSRMTDLSSPREDIAFAAMMNSYHKVVFSRTMEKTGWYNSRLAEGSPQQEVRELKQQPGKDMLIFGSGSIVSALSQTALIDEYILWVHPVSIGKGKPLFKHMGRPQTLKLLETKKCRSGVMILYYTGANLSTGPRRPNDPR